MLDPASQTRDLDTPALTRRHSPLAGTAEQPDLLLIERARGGSEQAIEALVRRYVRRLYRVARSVIVDDEYAELAVQEACIAAFGDLTGYEPTGKFAAWLTRLAYQHARSARLPGGRSLRPAAAAAAAAASGQLQERRELTHAIEQLPQVFRTVFVLRVVEGISGVETAASLGVHETTVRTRLYRALRRLDADRVRSIRLQPDLMDLPAAAAQRLVTATLAHLPHGPVPAGGAAAP
jgi:RNA polymerase sigma-70 factor (ECF subfamily)